MASRASLMPAARHPALPHPSLNSRCSIRSTLLPCNYRILGNPKGSLRQLTRIRYKDGSREVADDDSTTEIGSGSSSKGDTELGERGVIVPGSAKRIEVDVNDLRVTQIAVGYQQVHIKTQKVSDKNKTGGKLDDWLYKKKPIPAVKGPKGKYYIIDHHHLSRALSDANLTTCYIALKFGTTADDAKKHDWSGLDKDEFWQKMEEKKLLYHFDEEGNKLSLEELRKKLPKDVKGLKDDPYRSLSALVRIDPDDNPTPAEQMSGYIRQPVPFYEFKWANWLRKQNILGPEPTDEEVTSSELAARRAIYEAHQQNDPDLPDANIH